MNNPLCAASLGFGVKDLQTYSKHDCLARHYEVSLAMPRNMELDWISSWNVPVAVIRPS